MARRIARIALVAALMVGLVAMHSWGQRGHTAATETEPASVSAMAHHAGMSHHGREEAEPDGDETPGGLLSLLGIMVLCGGMLIRIAVAFLRPLLDRTLAVIAEAIAAEPARTRQWRPPIRLRPTSLLLNRIAVLRI
ncbi:hypothetical protein [Glycomyces sp. YM15]|uniref:hypothetical protein n=1 Tax=Glycomyces sp. YM15 TaxID=2800446 RepID=UPI001962B8D1|nr:hypothetical protein [Glycomyces sp. YM15]